MQSVTEIKNKIRSIKDTANITGAMQLISVAKLNHAEEKVKKNHTYADMLQDLMSFILNGAKVKSKFIKNAECTKTAYLVIASNTGMAGEYNHRVLKFALEKFKAKEGSFLFIIGQIAREFFEGLGIAPDVEYMYCADDPTPTDAKHIAGDLFELYNGGYIDEVRIIHTIQGGSACKAVDERLLPLCKDDFASCDSDRFSSSLEFEPGADEVLETLVPQYLQGKVYTSLVQAVKCEHTERIAAMSNATRNAEEMIASLNLQYFRARQDKITTELSEISAGNEVK